MSTLAEDLLQALAGDVWPAVVIYDPETGAYEDPGPRGSGRVFLPEIDPMPEEATENE